MDDLLLLCTWQKNGRKLQEVGLYSCHRACTEERRVWL